MLLRLGPEPTQAYAAPTEPLFIVLTTLFREERSKMMILSLLIFLVLSRKE